MYQTLASGSDALNITEFLMNSTGTALLVRVQ
jgi:hypothetical protein